MDVYIQGENTETKVVENHIMDLKKEGYNISKFYGDGAYDNYNMFNILEEIGADKAIKIKKMRQWVIIITKEKNVVGR